MISAEYTNTIRNFIIGLLSKLKLSNDTITKIDNIVPFEYYPFALLGLIVLVILICIAVKGIRRAREARISEQELIKSEEAKKREEDKRLSTYHSIAQMLGEELCVTEAKIEFELEKIFKNSPQLKDAETYHRVTVNRTPNERDIILSNWYMNNDTVEVIKNLISEELKKSEANNLKNEQFIKEAKKVEKESLGTWECKKCGNINKGSDDKCLKCGQVKSK